MMWLSQKAPHVKDGSPFTMLPGHAVSSFKNSFTRAPNRVKYKNHLWCVFLNHESADRRHLGHVQLPDGNNRVRGQTRCSAARCYSSFLRLFLSFLFSCKFFRSVITAKVFRTHIITMTMALKSSGVENTSEMNIPRESKY